MVCVRFLSSVFLTTLLAGCSGGGGGSASTPPGPAWEKFRRDLGNSGQADGGVADSRGQVTRAVAIDGSRILASPAISENGSVYVATEGGTFRTVGTTAALPSV